MKSFPQRWQQTTHATSLDPTAKRLALSAAALGVYLYLGRLSSSPLQTGNEAMYAYPPITMLETRARDGNRRITGASSENPTSFDTDSGTHRLRR